MWLVITTLIEGLFENKFFANDYLGSHFGLTQPFESQEFKRGRVDHVLYPYCFVGIWHLSHSLLQN